jgi:hypothetical protein
MARERGMPQQVSSDRRARDADDIGGRWRGAAGERPNAERKVRGATRQLVVSRAELQHATALANVHGPASPAAISLGSDLPAAVARMSGLT